MGTNNHYLEAARLIAQARAISDDFAGKSMPGEAGRQIEILLEDAGRERRAGQLEEESKYLNEPQSPLSAMDRYGRKSAGLESGSDHLSPERKAFWQWVKTGNAEFQRKATIAEDSDGQSLVEPSYAGTIVKTMAQTAVMRNLAFIYPTTKDRVDIGNITIGTPTWKRLEVAGTAPADALGAAPSKDTITVHELTALAKVGVDELADENVGNLEAIIRDQVAAKFAAVEDIAFFGGSGTDEPWAAHHTVTQTLAAAASNVPTPDDVRSLPFKIPANFRNSGRCAYVMHSKVESALSLWKDNDGNYLLQPRVSEAQPGTIFGYRYAVSDALEDPATAGTTQKSVLFGDFFSGYCIAHREGITVQRLVERYAELGLIGLLFKLRVGGDVIRPAALATYTL